MKKNVFINVGKHRIRIEDIAGSIHVGQTVTVALSTEDGAVFSVDIPAKKYSKEELIKVIRHKAAEKLGEPEDEQKEVLDRKAEELSLLLGLKE